MGLIKRKHKVDIWASANWRCHYCGVPIFEAGDDQPMDAPDTATIDHVIPRCDGGRDWPDNLVASCFNCNHVKADARDWPTLPFPTLGDLIANG